MTKDEIYAALALAGAKATVVTEFVESFRLEQDGDSTWTFQQLMKLSEVLKTDRINVVNSRGFRTECTYEPGEHYLEILK